MADATKMFAYYNNIYQSHIFKRMFKHTVTQRFSEKSITTLHIVLTALATTKTWNNEVL